MRRGRTGFGGRKGGGSSGSDTGGGSGDLPFGCSLNSLSLSSSGGNLGGSDGLEITLYLFRVTVLIWGFKKSAFAPNTTTC